VTPSYHSTLSALSAIGIGPWRIYTCTPQNTTSQTYRGQPSPFTLKFCYATLGPLTYEVIQPISGPSIFADYLSSSGNGGGGRAGLHHVAYDCNGIPMADRVRGFEERGWKMVQGGDWGEGNKFAFFEGGEGVEGTWVETIEMGGGEWPPCEEWFPEGAGGEGREGKR